MLVLNDIPCGPPHLCNAAVQPKYSHNNNPEDIGPLKSYNNPNIFRGYRRYYYKGFDECKKWHKIEQSIFWVDILNLPIIYRRLIIMSILF